MRLYKKYKLEEVVGKHMLDLEGQDNVQYMYDETSMKRGTLLRTREGMEIRDGKGKTLRLPSGTCFTVYSYDIDDGIEAKIINGLHKGKVVSFGLFRLSDVDVIEDKDIEEPPVTKGMKGREKGKGKGKGKGKQEPSPATPKEEPEAPATIPFPTATTEENLVATLESMLPIPPKEEPLTLKEGGCYNVIKKYSDDLDEGVFLGMAHKLEDNRWSFMAFSGAKAGEEVYVNTDIIPFSEECDESALMELTDSWIKNQTSEPDFFCREVNAALSSLEYAYRRLKEVKEPTELEKAFLEAYAYRLYDMRK